MRKLLVTSCLASAALAGASPIPDPGTPEPARPQTKVVLENERVRILRTTAGVAVGHPAAVVVNLGDGGLAKAGEAYWSGAAGGPPDKRQGDATQVVIVEPKGPAPTPRAAAAPGSDPSPPGGASPFTGVSFELVFENERVAVRRARMEVGAQEPFHTHASDLVVVHLSGGSIEDTANGKTRINVWRKGDVEFEARGTSHSARNAGAAVDVVLVTLKP